VELGVATRLRRTRETLELALGGRDVGRLVVPALDEIGFGSFESGPLGEYRAWAWAAAADVVGPGGAESRAAAAARFAGALASLLERPEETILAVTHALPVRYVLDAADGLFPAARITRVPHATPFALGAGAVERAVETLGAWVAAPRFAQAREDPSFGSPHRAL
jgi:broad specificity phosphatase PhoE